jgi:hypothetical protein
MEVVKDGQCLRLWDSHNPYHLKHNLVTTPKMVVHLLPTLVGMCIQCDLLYHFKCDECVSLCHLPTKPNMHDAPYTP